MFMRSAGCCRAAATCTPRRGGGASGSTAPAAAATMPAMDEHPATAKLPRRPDDEPISSPFMVGPDDPGTAPARSRRLLPIDVRALAAALSPRRSALPVALGALAAGAIVLAVVVWALAPRGASL